MTRPSATPRNARAAIKMRNSPDASGEATIFAWRPLPSAIRISIADGRRQRDFEEDAWPEFADRDRGPGRQMFRLKVALPPGPKQK